MRLIKVILTGVLYLAISLPMLAQTTGTLNFSCVTTAPTGSYGAKHVIAIWIQANANPSVFVKTNAKYGFEDDHLTWWIAQTSENMVDAFSGSTLTPNSNISVDWDGTDVAHNVVADGDYTLYIEIGWGRNKSTDHAIASYNFTKGPNAKQLSPSSGANFSAISLSWQPATTLMVPVDSEKGINVFPNPSRGAIKLNVQEELLQAKLEVVNVSGKQVYLEELEQLIPGIKTLDLPDLPAGMYLLTVSANERYFRYKLLVE